MFPEIGMCGNTVFTLFISCFRIYVKATVRCGKEEGPQIILAWQGGGAPHYIGKEEGYPDYTTKIPDLREFNYCKLKS